PLGADFLELVGQMFSEVHEVAYSACQDLTTSRLNAVDLRLFIQDKLGSASPLPGLQKIAQLQDRNGRGRGVGGEGDSAAQPRGLHRMSARDSLPPHPCPSPPGVPEG